MSEITTVGRQLLQDILPAGYENVDTPLDSKELSKLMTRLAKEVPRDVYVDTLKKLTLFGHRTANDYGGAASIHLRDVSIPPELQVIRRKLQNKVYSIAQRRDMSSADKKQAIIKLVKDATPEIDKMVISTLKNSDNSFGLLAGAGVKGNPQQIRQLVFGDLLTVDSKMRDIPYPTFRSYGEGVTPLQYWTASHGGRYGYIQVQKATADAGYFSKQTRGVVHRQTVTMDDCGKARGYRTAGSSPDNIGALLHDTVKGKSGKQYAKDTIITEDMLDDMPDVIAIRSAICCGAGDGVCSKCAGVRESGRLPDIGDAVGLNGINASNEQLTQSGLSSKHSGGESVSAKRVKRGFAAIDQFINMPDNFVGGAAVSPVTGRVSSVSEAPQGGTNIQVGDTTVYIPTGLDPLIKAGDAVEAGDLISDGMPNVEIITKYKGIGEGRKAFVESFMQLLKDNGLGVPRKQIEPFARAYIDRVEITDPDGVQGWIYGDIAQYNVLERNWKPRAGAVEAKPKDAIGKYIEMPVLHYTIGTKITDKVAKQLTDAGYNTVTVHNQGPPFIPHITSAKQFNADDPDWITALSGEGLTKSFLKHVQQGSTSVKGGTSYYGDLAFVGTSGEPELTL